MQPAIKINTAESKEVLTFVRNGDYAHAGEEDAIDLLFRSLPKISQQVVLDIGCGLGGTANYIQQRGWGAVIGLDMNPEFIQYAEGAYPNAQFVCADIFAKLPEMPTPDIISMFCVLYVLSDQDRALHTLRRLAKRGTRLAVFDYVDLGGYEKFRPMLQHDVLPSPIDMGDLARRARSAGWAIDSVVDLTDSYSGWYTNFVAKIMAMRDEILEFADRETFDFVYKTYHGISQAIASGCLGGAMIYATAI